MGQGLSWLRQGGCSKTQVPLLLPNTGQDDRSGHAAALKFESFLGVQSVQVQGLPVFLVVVVGGGCRMGVGGCDANPRQGPSIGFRPMRMIDGRIQGEDIGCGHDQQTGITRPPRSQFGHQTLQDNDRRG